MRSILRIMTVLLAIAVFSPANSATTFANEPFHASAKAAAARQARRHAEIMQDDAARSLMRRAELARKIRWLERRGAGRDAFSFNIIHTKVVFDAEESAGTIDTANTITIQATADNMTQAGFYFMPLDEYRVEDGDGNALETVYDDWAQYLVVTLPAALNTGDQTDLVFFNAGVPNCEPDAYFGMVFCRVSEEIVFDTSGYWIPTKAGNSYLDIIDGGTVDFDISTPPDYIAVTTSDPTGVDDLGDRLVHHFVGNFSNWAGAAMAYAKFQTFTSMAGSKPVTTLLHTGVMDYAQSWADTGADIIDYFSQVFVPYEYNKQDIIQAIEELGGGVGPESATFYYASALNTDPATIFSESIFSHEIGHSWWANMIRPGDMNSPWLSEGFAEYSSRLYGYQVWDNYYQDYLYQFYFNYYQFYVTPEMEVPLTSPSIFTDDSMVYFLTTYDKGAHVVRMLQWLLGDEDFFAGMAQYAADFTWDNTHQAVTVDAFRNAMETASGMDLQNFFDQWIYDTGYPVYHWAAEFGQDDIEYTARVRVEQIQDSDIVYDLPLEVLIYVGEEDEPRSYRIDFSGKIADQTFTFDQPPRGLKVDDAYWIWGDKVPALAGDVDGSNQVDGIDLIYTAWAQGGEFLYTDQNYNYISEADFNRDGVTDSTDLNLLLGNFAKKGAIDE